MGKDTGHLRHSEFEQFVNFPLGLTDVSLSKEHEIETESSASSVTEARTHSHNRMRELLGPTSDQAMKRALIRMAYGTVKESWQIAVQSYAEQNNLDYNYAESELLRQAGYEDQDAFWNYLAENIARNLSSMSATSHTIGILQVACEEFSAQYVSSYCNVQSLPIVSTNFNPFQRGIAKISYRTVKSLWNSSLDEKSVKQRVPRHILRARILADFGFDDEKSFLNSVAEAVSEILVSNLDAQIDIALLQVACERISDDILKKLYSDTVSLTDESSKPLDSGS